MIHGTAVPVRTVGTETSLGTVPGPNRLGQVLNGILNTFLFSFGTCVHFSMSCDFSASPSSSKIRPLLFP